METNKSYSQVIEEIQSNAEIGLTSKEAQERLEKYGKNELTEKKNSPFIVKFLCQFKDFLVIILLLAAAISVIVSPEEWIESVIILIVVLINSILGAVQESKAEKSLAALKKLSTPHAKVIRDGQTIVVNSYELVPGDIIVIEAGDFVPADARLIQAVNLLVDESALTGESVPVLKNTDLIEKANVSIGDQTNCLFSSTYVTYGRGKAVITKTGMNTEIGKIAEMLMEHKEETTPLQVKLDQIGKVIGIICIFICVVVFALEYYQSRDIKDSFINAVALAVASIPEGLATIVTVILAIGVEKMVRHKAIVKKLPAVETLGCASVICSDKTGTLTQNKMTVVKLYADSLKEISSDLNENESKMLEMFSLCCDAKSEEVDGEIREIGDPTEIAMIVAMKKYVSNPKYQDLKRFIDLPFDSERKMMTVILEYNGKYLVVTKGAPDIIINRSINHSFALKGLKVNDDMANLSLRVLAVGIKELDELPKDITPTSIEYDLEFLGLIGMIDPARPEVKDSIRVATKAGIRTIMITGDHVATAKAIASELGILRPGDLAISSAELHALDDETLFANIEKYSVYARVAPEDKVRIVDAWQKKGHVVAMTGDGVNDSPALKKADIGCAMGITGTDVSKEAADVILVDDNFKTIVTAVEQGRGIYDNIKKVVQYLLSSNIGEVLTIFLASLISIVFKNDPILGAFGLPLAAVHLLWVNLITDSLPAFALGTEEVSAGVMEDAPRAKNESFFAHGIGINIIWQGIMVGLLTLTAYAIGHYLDPAFETGETSQLGQTMAFITLSSTQLFHAFNMKSNKSIFNRKLFKNKYLVGAFVVGMLVQIAIIYLPGINTLFKVQPLDFPHLMICIGLGASSIVIVELVKLFTRLLSKNK